MEVSKADILLCFRERNGLPGSEIEKGNGLEIQWFVWHFYDVLEMYKFRSLRERKTEEAPGGAQTGYGT